MDDNRCSSIEASIDKLSERFTLHEDAEKQVHEESMKVVKGNTEAVEALVANTSDMTELLNAWQAANGAIKVLTVVGKVLKWLAGIVVVIAGIASYVKS